MSANKRVRSRIAVFFAIGCAACGVHRGPAPRDPTAVPVWERPGMAGAIRPEMGKPQPGDAAPAFELPVAGGGTLRLESLRGSWVVMHFTATWCPFCDAEVEHLGDLADAFAARGVRVLMIDVKEDVDHFVHYARERIPAAVVPLYDVSGAAAIRYAPPQAQPSFADRSQVMFDTTLVVDPEGVIRLFLFPDSAHFDPTFRGVRRELARLVGDANPPVTVSVDTPEPLAPGAQSSLQVHIAIDQGYHVMSDRPPRSNYVATAVRIDSSDAVDTGPPGYPSPVDFDLGEHTLPTYQGHIDVTVPLHVGAKAAGNTVLRGSVRYQACTRSRCLAPTTLPFQAKLRIEESPTR